MLQTDGVEVQAAEVVGVEPVPRPLTSLQLAVPESAASVRQTCPPQGLALPVVDGHATAAVVVSAIPSMPAHTTCDPPPVEEAGVIPGLHVPLQGPPAAMVFTMNEPAAQLDEVLLSRLSVSGLPPALATDQSLPVPSLSPRQTRQEATSMRVEACGSSV